MPDFKQYHESLASIEDILPFQNGYTLVQGVHKVSQTEVDIKIVSKQDLGQGEIADIRNEINMYKIC